MRCLFLFLGWFVAAAASAQAVFDLPVNSKPQGKAAEFYNKQEVQRDKDTYFEKHQYEQTLEFADRAYRAGKYVEALNYYQDAKSMYLQLRSHASASNDTSFLDQKIMDCSEKVEWGLAAAKPHSCQGTNMGQSSCQRIFFCTNNEAPPFSML